MSTIKADAITASTGTNTNIGITGKGSGKVKLGDGNLLFPDADGSANQYIKTDGSGNLSFGAITETSGSQYFFINLSGTQVIGTTSNTKVEFDTVVHDTENDFDDSTNYRYDFDAGTAGLWMIGHYVYMQNANALAGSFLSKTGTIVDLQWINAGAQSNKFGGVYLDTYTADDFVHVETYQQSGSNKNCLSGRNGTTFWGVRLA